MTDSARADMKHATELSKEARNLGFSAADSSWRQLYLFTKAICGHVRESTAKEIAQKLRDRAEELRTEHNYFGAEALDAEIKQIEREYGVTP